MWPLTLTAGALLPIAALSVAFPEGGAQPFVASAFYPALLGVLVVAALIPAGRDAVAADTSREELGDRRGEDSGETPSDGSSDRPGDSPLGGYAADRRVLRIGGVLYGLVLIGAYALPSAVGGNADRLWGIDGGAAGGVRAGVLAPALGDPGAGALPSVLAGERAGG